MPDINDLKRFKNQIRARCKNLVKNKKERHFQLWEINADILSFKTQIKIEQKLREIFLGIEKGV